MNVNSIRITKYISTVLAYFMLLHIVEANDNVQKNYTPLPRNPPPSNILEEFNKLPVLTSEKYPKEFKDLSVALNEEVKSGLDSNAYYFDDVVFPLVKNITQHIIQSNPILKDIPVRVLVSRSHIPNAFALPNGVIEVNMGLLRYLDTEDQLAFIIGHEIAHVYLQHSVKGYTQYLDQIKSKEFKKEITEIKNSEYQVYSKAVQLAEKMVYNERKHSRTNEFEADSLGLIFLSKTKYSTQKAVNGIIVLDEIDKEKLKDSLKLSEIFHTETYPFKPRWIKENTFIKSTDTLTQAQIDSLKTHPDTPLRKEHLDRVYNEKNLKVNPQTNNSSTFEKIKTIADFECLSNLYHLEVISYSTYLNLKLLQLYPENEYLKSMLLKNLLKVKEGLEKMKLSGYIRKPNPFDTGDYKQLILLLNNIRPSEIDQIIREISKKYSINQTN